MRVAVIGGGAMGGSLAGHAAAAGHQVTVIDPAPPVVEAIRRDGLTIQAPERSWTVAVEAELDPSGVGPVDVVVIFVKAAATRAAADFAAALRGPDTIVATLQNGWGNADVVAQSIPADSVVLGVTYNSCTSLAPGVIKHSGRGATVVGPYLQDADMAASELVAEVLSSSGWPTTAARDAQTAIWKKLVLNAATLPTAALTGLSAGAVGEFAPTARLVADLTDEAVLVAHGLGFDVDAAERHQAIAAVLAAAGSGKPSMLQDVAAQRKTEIETINGAVVAAADRLAIAVPINRAMVELIAGLERSWQQ
jgi:2-dehydropantoate 2-reductase